MSTTKPVKLIQAGQGVNPETVPSQDTRSNPVGHKIPNPEKKNQGMPGKFPKIGQKSNNLYKQSVSSPKNRISQKHRFHSPNLFKSKQSLARRTSISPSRGIRRPSFSMGRIDKAGFKLAQKVNKNCQISSAKENSYFLFDIIKDKEEKAKKFMKKIKTQNKNLFSSPSRISRKREERKVRRRSIGEKMNGERKIKKKQKGHNFSYDQKIVDFYKNEFKSAKRDRSSDRPDGTPDNKIPSNIPYHIREDRRMPKDQKKLVLFKHKIKGKGENSEIFKKKNSANKTSGGLESNLNLDSSRDVFGDENEDGVIEFEDVKQKFEKYSEMFLEARKEENYGNVIKNSDRAEMNVKFFNQIFIKLQLELKKISEMDGKEVSRTKKEINTFYEKYEQILEFFAGNCKNLFTNIHSNYELLLNCLISSGFEFTKLTRKISFKFIEDIYYSFSGLRNDEVFTAKGLPKIEIWENYAETLKL